METIYFHFVVVDNFQFFFGNLKKLQKQFKQRIFSPNSNQDNNNQQKTKPDETHNLFIYIIQTMNIDCQCRFKQSI